MTSPLTQTAVDMHDDVIKHIDEFDAIVCGGDFHGLILGGLLSADTGKPLIAVCSDHHTCTVQHSVTYGDIDPRMRFLYVDDFFTMGRTLATVFEYMNQTCKYVPDYPKANIVATYEATTREYKTL